MACKGCSINSHSQDAKPDRGATLKRGLLWCIQRCCVNKGAKVGAAQRRKASTVQVQLPTYLLLISLSLSLSMAISIYSTEVWCMLFSDLDPKKPPSHSFQTGAWDRVWRAQPASMAATEVFQIRVGQGNSSARLQRSNGWVKHQNIVQCLW